MSDEDRTVLTARLEELHGRVCRCGTAKTPDQTFCRDCYFRLPMPMRRALYLLILDGYIEAYDDAVTFLDTPLQQRGPA